MKVDGFEIQDEIGRGGFGVVYRARQLAFNRLVAIKVLHTGNSATDLQKQFARECSAVGALRNHPNILSVYSTGSTGDGAPYLAMELLVGGTLSERIPMSVEAARALGIKLASALDLAHQGGVIHRDVKPANVLYDDDDEPVLVDFGISSIVGEASTTSSNVALSLGYAPPEVFDGARPTRSVDVYALGATLFAAVSGRTPFVGQDGYSSIAVLAARILKEPVEDLRRLGVPDDFCRVIEKAMAKDPGARYTSMAELRTALERVGGDDTVRVSASPWRPTRPMPPEHATPASGGPRRGLLGTRRRAALAALVLVLCAGATAVAVGLNAFSTPGHPTAGSTISPKPKTTPVRRGANDLNCDGHDDFLAVSTDPKPTLKNALRFYPRHNMPDPSGLPTTWLLPSPSFVTADKSFGVDSFVSLVLPGDMNGDGRPDVVGEKRDGSLWLMPGHCTGVITSQSARQMAPTPFGQVQLSADGDFNGDGFPDLLGVDGDHTLFLFAGTGRGTLRAPVEIDTSWTSAIGVGDVSGDSHPDVIDRLADGSLRLYESDGSGHWKKRGIPLSLKLPPSEFPYVLGGYDTSLGAYPDLVATDRQAMLVSFAATGAAPPETYHPTCVRVGGGWSPLPPSDLIDIAGATRVPSAPLPAYLKPRSPPVPECKTKTF